MMGSFAISRCPGHQHHIWIRFSGTCFENLQLLSGSVLPLSDFRGTSHYLCWRRSLESPCRLRQYSSLSWNLTKLSPTPSISSCKCLLLKTQHPFYYKSSKTIQLWSRILLYPSSGKWPLSWKISRIRSCQDQQFSRCTYHRRRHTQSNFLLRVGELSLQSHIWHW